MKYLAIIIYFYTLPSCLISQNKNSIVDKESPAYQNELISASNTRNSTTTNFSTKKQVIEINQADSSIIIKETPLVLLKHRNLVVKQADASIIINVTPPELLKHKSLTMKQADVSMIIKETPPELLKIKFK